jgi:hypothetical protein
VADKPSWAFDVAPADDLDVREDVPTQQAEKRYGKGGVTGQPLDGDDSQVPVERPESSTAALFAGFATSWIR